MVDALPYLVDYPYGCTEQTLNRFLPAVITQQTLLRDEARPEGDPARSAPTSTPRKSATTPSARKGWKRFDRNPVFDEAELTKIVKAGVNRLTEMQLSDGGWGWFSGWGEQSTPHTTARRRPRPANRQAERRGARARRARARRRVAQALSGRAAAPHSTTSTTTATSSTRTSRPSATPTTSTRSSTWCSSTPTSRTTRCATSSIATAPSSPSTA